MISVIMTVYNEKLKWLKEAVNSILNQTYKDLEVIIVVDNPNLCDEDKLFLEEVQKSDKRVVLSYNEKNLGLPASLNRAINFVHGEYIARMDADDISLLDRLEKEIKYLQENDFDMVFTSKTDINEENEKILDEKIEEGNLNDLLHIQDIVIHSSVLIKTSVMKDLNGYRLMRNSEDYDLWLRLLDKGYKIGFLKERLILYRVRNNSITGARAMEQFFAGEYIKSLSKERIKKGHDSYSKEHEEKYFKKCRLTDKRKAKFAKAYSKLEVAVNKYRNHKKVSAFFSVLKAWFVFPKITNIYMRNFLKKVL